MRPVYSLADFARYAAQFRTDAGKPMHLERFQREMLKAYFDGVEETVIIIPKKNGKTTLLAVLALYHLERTPDAECIIAAATQEQARKLFNQAAAMIRRSGLKERFRIMTGYGHIYPPGGDSAGPRVEVRPATPENLDGVTPTLGLIDELHRHHDNVAYGIIRDGLVAKQGRMVTISTAGTSAESPLGQTRERLHQHPSFRRDHKAKRNYALSEAMVLHEWCLDPTEDVWDMALVKKANPAPWHTVSGLKKKRYSESMTDGQWLRYYCGIWTEGEEPWLEPQSWDDLGDRAMKIPDGSEVVIAVDLGPRAQDTAIVVVAKDGDRYLADAMISPPTGEVLPTERELERLAEVYAVNAVVHGSPNFRRSAEALLAKGIPVEELPLNAPQRMEEASATLRRIIEEGNLVHNGDPAFRAHVLAGIVKESERGWRLAKDPKTRRSVGALLALAMGVEVWQAFAPKSYWEL